MYSISLILTDEPFEPHDYWVILSGILIIEDDYMAWDIDA